MDEKIVHEDDLGNLRRSHYSFQISRSNIDESVVIIGWISSKRDHGNVLFVQLRDQFGEMQVVVKKKELSSDLFNTIRNLKEHSSLGITGEVVEQKNSLDQVEIIPKEIKILSISNKPAPFLTQAVSSVGIDTRLDLRAIDLRRNHLQYIFKIRNTVINSIREYFNENYFVEVNTPKMIATATEGGAALFPIFYYDREAFLAQSPQLYKEQLTMAFESVFEIAPIFRAEPSRTNRHLSEAISVDAEKAYVDYRDMMDHLEKLIHHIINKINTKNANELENLGISLPQINNSFTRITYSDLVRKLQANHKYIRWGDDISPKILKDLFGDEFFFIIEWPASTKPFYVKSITEDDYSAGKDIDEKNRLSESFDLMFGGGGAVFWEHPYK
jgi:aspartyl-tRNA synthetase